MKLLGEVVLPIKKNQELSYENLKENSSLTNFLENAIYLDEKKMFEISQQITFDFKKSRRRSNSNSNT